MTTTIAFRKLSNVPSSILLRPRFQPHRNQPCMTSLRLLNSFPYELCGQVPNHGKRTGSHERTVLKHLCCKAMAVHKSHSRTLYNNPSYQIKYPPGSESVFRLIVAVATRRQWCERGANGVSASQCVTINLWEIFPPENRMRLV